MALKPGGRCFFEVYNKDFAIEHGVERTLFYDDGRNRFVPIDGDPEKLSVRLYNNDEWQALLNPHGLKIEKRENWGWKGDPQSPPARAEMIVARRC